MSRWMIVGEYQGCIVDVPYANIPEWACNIILQEIWDGTRRSDERLNYVAYKIGD